MISEMACFRAAIFLVRCYTTAVMQPVHSPRSLAPEP
jgi:hypothetical protein